MEMGRQHMKKTLIALIALLFVSSAYTAQEYSSISWTRSNQHQTTNTTWTPASSTVIANTIIMNVSNAGTSWIITVKDKAATPKILWTGTATLGTVYILQLPVGIQMDNGIDVTFSGTAGVADFFTAYR